MGKRAGVLMALVLAGCGGEGPWQRVTPSPIAERPMPAVVSEVPGTGAPVRFGDLVELEVEILEPSSTFHGSRRGETRRIWTFIGSLPSGELGSETARKLLEGRSVATQLTVYAKTGSSKAGRPADHGLPTLPDQPFAPYKSSLVVHDSVYRMHILRACPAEAAAAKVSRTFFAFDLPCKGDFLPTSCSWPTFWKSSELTRHRITATCGREKLDFRNRVKGD